MSRLHEQPESGQAAGHRNDVGFDCVAIRSVSVEVVDEATTGRLMGKVREQQLPDQFDRLFEAGSQGQMRRTG